jgi:hypothetical protein
MLNSKKNSIMKKIKVLLFLSLMHSTQSCTNDLNVVQKTMMISLSEDFGINRLQKSSWWRVWRNLSLTEQMDQLLHFRAA